MTSSIVGVFFALISFIVTFAVARTLGKWVKKRRAQKAEEQAARMQSRQVRRANARSRRTR